MAVAATGEQNATLAATLTRRGKTSVCSERTVPGNPIARPRHFPLSQNRGGGGCCLPRAPRKSDYLPFRASNLVMTSFANSLQTSTAPARMRVFTRNVPRVSNFGLAPRY